ncbi:MAG: hypothetical protein IJY89_01360 [Clostridia bacterium]|nr:hypothetical protein [Clostridia bacterium]MBQ8911201.1 hypothetical protein [Clostridia bacterium]
MKYCSKCGKELFDEAVICVGCGCPVKSAATKNETDPEHSKLMAFVAEAKSIYILGIISLVLCLGIGIIFQIINLAKLKKYSYGKATKKLCYPEFNLTSPYDVATYEDAKRKITIASTMTRIGFGISIALIFFAIWFGIVMPALL